MTEVAHSTNPLGDNLSIAGVSASQDHLKSAKKHARAPGLFDDTILHLALNLQMPFDSGDGVNDDLSHIVSPSYFFGGVSISMVFT
jgi:hypothetical protein